MASGPGAACSQERLGLLPTPVGGVARNGVDSAGVESLLALGKWRSGSLARPVA